MAMYGLWIEIARYYADTFDFFQILPGKFCNRLLTEILTEVPMSEFNQPFNR